MNKNIFIIILILIFLLSANVFVNADEWDKTDTFFQTTYIVLHIIDWNQTLTIAKNPDKWYEKNSILGKHPSQGKVNLYFINTLIGHTIISYILPKEYRRIWQITWIGIESNYVYQNYKLGIRINF